MKGILLSLSILLGTTLAGTAQVTQLNANGNLEPEVPLPNGQTILVSDTDSALWASNGTPAGTVKLSTAIHYIGSGGILNGKLIFSARTDATGAELFITDGTVGGTMLLSDIYPGAIGSTPDEDFALLNGYIYFTAARPAEGRELWRTNGTPAGTELVKDIVAGPTSSNTPDDYNLFSNGTYILFSATSAAAGAELWITNGTSAGTMMVMDISAGAASSKPDFFTVLNNMVIFQATDLLHGTEFWKTDGTTAGTMLLKDINPGPASMKPLIDLPLPYHFKNKLYFIANDGVHGDEIWMTDGTTDNTLLLKDIHDGAFSTSLLINAVTIGDKFFFSTSNIVDRFELWQSDGTTAGTTLFKAFDAADYSGTPFIYPPYTYDFGNNEISQTLFQGNKFFFSAGTQADGVELWVSDGTLGGTKMVKNIGPGDTDGLEIGSFTYTSQAVYFAANNATNGNELWKSDGTSDGTVMVADINTGTGDSDPVLPYFLNNGKLFFSATDGDQPTNRDLYVIDGVLPLPVQLVNFTVNMQGGNAQLQWTTSQEINSRDFVLQRSTDGRNFITIGTVAATGNSAVKQFYNYVDAGVGTLNTARIFYRLQQRSKDGSSSLSRIISCNLLQSDLLQVRLLNNPVSAVLPIQLEANGKVMLSIRDISGKIVGSARTTNGSGFTELPITNLAPSVYVLVVEGATEKKVLQFVKR